MDIFVKAKIKKIQDYIVDLYSLRLKNGEYNAEAVKMFNDKSFDNWCASLGSYSEEHIKGAINQYHQTKNNKSAPRIRQIKEILEKDHPNKVVADMTNKYTKPVCPIIGWQEDFDIVLKNACIKGIVRNPYWSSQEDVIVAHKKFIATPFADKKATGEWIDSVHNARIDNPIEFNKVASYNDDILLFTFAYRTKHLEV